MADKKTTFQQLNGLFNLDGTSTASTNKTANSKIILRGKTPDEIKRKNLEVQQQNALRNKFFNSTDHGFQKAMQYESARISAYIDYEGFEYYPIVASALDLLMEESTTIGENGKMLNIYSNNDRISKNLEELFYDTLNINTNLPFWTRNLVKYGNNFVHILGEKKKGIIASKQLVNYEMDRIERIVDGRNEVRFQQKETQDKYNQFEMIHFRLLTDDKYIPYGTSVLSKVRRVVRQLILAEDAMLTYRIVRAGEKKIFKIDVGNIDEDDVENYLDKVSSRFKKQQQVYPNDGQIDYRFNILGNDEDYFIPVRNSNVQTGIDTLPGACLALDSKIELLDGRSLELNEIIKEYEEGKELWSYSINPEDGEVVPGKITWAGVTRKDTDIIKITLDNGEIIKVTPDHKFPTKYNGIKEAKDLKEDESLWSFNKKFNKLKGEKKTNDYEMVYNHKSKKYEFTHRIMHDYIFGECENGTVRHHVDFNRFNNNPTNLQKMDMYEHFKLHAEHSIIGGNAYKEKYDTDEGFKNEVNERLSQSRKKYHFKLASDKEFSDKVKRKQSKSTKKYINSLSEVELLERNERLINAVTSPEARKRATRTFNFNPNRQEIIDRRIKNGLITKHKPENRKKYSENTKKIWLNEEIRNAIIEKQTLKYSNNLLDKLIQYTKKHKTISNVLKYEINIDGSDWVLEFNELNKNNKQFTVKSKTITPNNIRKLIRHFGYNDWKHFRNTVNEYNHKIVSIEYLDQKEDTGTITIDGYEEYHNYHNFALTCGVFTQNSNLNDINDISYLRDNLFTGIGIPKPFLGFQDSSGDGKNMAQMDIRFAKKINRIQQALIQELNKMAIIHLHLLGFSKDDLSNFTLSLTNPSTQEELLKVELLREKGQVYNDLTRVEGGIAAMSHTEAKRRLFNMSDKDIVDDFKMQRMERTLAQELTDSPIVIKKTGLFDDVDKIYGDGSLPPSQEEGGEGGDLEQGEGSLETNEPPIGGDTDDAPQSPTDLPPVEGESLKKRQVMSEHEYESRLNALMNIGKKEKTTEKMNLMEMDDKNTSLNKKADSLSDELDELLNESQKFNTNEGEINMRNFHTNKMDEEFDLMKLNIEEAKNNKKEDKK